MKLNKEIQNFDKSYLHKTAYFKVPPIIVECNKSKEEIPDEENKQRSGFNC